MEAVAYYVALLTLVTVPATLVAWLVVHPFASVWRRLGPAKSSAVVVAVVLCTMWVMYLVRQPLLEGRFGVRGGLVGASAVLLAVSLYMNVLVYREAPKAMALGLAELGARHGGRLVTSGIYSRVRHPRFVAMFLAVAAMALFTNALAVYVLVIVYAPVIALVAVLEERELKARFGLQYEEYRDRVPRFLPRFAGRGACSGSDAT